MVSLIRRKTMLLRPRHGRSSIAFALGAIVALVCLAGLIVPDDGHHSNLVVLFLPVLFFELFALVFAGGFAPVEQPASEREALLPAVCPRAPPA